MHRYRKIFEECAQLCVIVAEARVLAQNFDKRRIFHLETAISE